MKPRRTVTSTRVFRLQGGNEDTARRDLECVPRSTLIGALAGLAFGIGAAL